MESDSEFDANLGHLTVVWIYDCALNELVKIEKLPPTGKKAYFLYYRQKTIPDPEEVGDYDSIILIATRNSMFRDMVDQAVAKKIKHIEGFSYEKSMKPNRKRRTLKKMNGGLICNFNRDLAVYKSYKWTVFRYMKKVSRTYWTNRKNPAWKEAYEKDRKKKRNLYLAKRAAAEERRKRKIESNKQMTEAKKQRLMELEEERKLIEADVIEESDDDDDDSVFEFNDAEAEAAAQGDPNYSIDSEVEDRLKEMEFENSVNQKNSPKEREPGSREDSLKALNDFGKDDKGLLNSDDDNKVESANSDINLSMEDDNGPSVKNNSPKDNTIIEDCFSPTPPRVYNNEDGQFQAASKLIGMAPIVNEAPKVTLGQVIGGLSLATSMDASLAPFDAKTAEAHMTINNVAKSGNSPHPRGSSTPRGTFLKEEEKIKSAQRKESTKATKPSEDPEKKAAYNKPEIKPGYRIPKKRDESTPVRRDGYQREPEKKFHGGSRHDNHSSRSGHGNLSQRRPHNGRK